MVARVALANDDNSAISAVTHISALQFQPNTPNATQSERESIHTANGGSHLLQEPKELEEKQGGALRIA